MIFAIHSQQHDSGFASRHSMRVRRLAELLLVQQVLLEGLGDVVLRQLDRYLMESDDRMLHLGRMIQRQEEQNHAFGLCLLDWELHRDRAAQPQLEKIRRFLSQQAEDLMAGLSGAFEALDPGHLDFAAELYSDLTADLPGAAV